MMKKWIYAAVVVVVVLMGLNIAAPHLAAYGLYRGLSRHMELSPDNVLVEASPGLSVLTGRLDRVHAGGADFRVGKLRFQSFDCTLEGVRFNPLTSLMDGRLQAESAEQGELLATVSQEDLSNFLKKQVKGTDQMDVAFEGDTIHVRGKVRIGGFLRADADIAGRFAMEGTKLMFLPEDAAISAKGVRVNASNLARLEVYDFSDFPLHMVPDQVSLDNGLLTLHGRVSNH